MTGLKKTLAAGIAVLVTLAGIAWFVLRSPSVQDALYRRAVDQILDSTRNDLLRTDALRVLLCGTGNPLPDPNRADACTAVFADGKMYLVDTGPGAWKNLALWRIPGAPLAGVMLTHFHSDHIGDLGEVNLQTWALGRDHPLPVYGPPGVDQVVKGFSEAYALDEGYRIAHHGAALMPTDKWPMQPIIVNMPPGSRPFTGSATVLDEDGLKVTAFAVDHSPVTPAYGYRFDYKGRSVVISGDTAKCPNLVEAARGADLLIDEAQAAPMVQMIGEEAARRGNVRGAKIMHDIQRYHTTPIQAAEEANQAGVSLLVLSHLGPPTPNAIARAMFMRGVSAVRPGGVVMGSDGSSSRCRSARQPSSARR
jgi:ribonuclease Z